MKKSQMTTKARQRAIVEIMNKGITSPTEIVKILQSEYGIETTRQTVHRDIANGVQPITEEIIDDHKDTMLDNLDSLLEIAYNKGMRGDSAAMKVYGHLLQVRASVLQKIVEIQHEINKTERPIYVIRIGEFPEVEVPKKKEDDKNDESN